MLAVGTGTGLPAFDGDGDGGDQVRVHRTDACEAYGKGLFLVRPDGYIGWAGEDASGLARYLAPLGVTAVTRC
ncbi:aromatic-ring hydroxylase C-terminal domain-containing protein [Streptomyces sp. NBC_01591]|uniref:aromatic-ring hydroxylase C-terminal domain-containing protein n=1 Tax=Streptomyces sp. NBC_01591 TaxID=2975888 RepID=UPI003FA37499